MRASEQLMTMQGYRRKFLQELTDLNSLNHFDSKAENRNGGTLKMLFFPDSEWVPGGAWPGNYGMVYIIDYNTHMVRRGGVWVTRENGDQDYVDRDGMDDLVPYKLPTTAENISTSLAKRRLSYHNMPYWVGEKYKDRLLVTVAGTPSQSDQLTEEMLAEALAGMTPFDRSKYEQSLYKIDVSLYPSVEQPVRFRIDGIDDGAEEALFADVASALKVLDKLTQYNNRNTRHHSYGFKGTD